MKKRSLYSKKELKTNGPDNYIHTPAKTLSQVQKVLVLLPVVQYDNESESQYYTNARMDCI